jgi:ArsR family transcriptional regulator, arsenate/arsenite/antimonite-responsive transcriptional repressor
MKIDTGKMAKVFKALSNSNRLELFLEILKKHQTSFETGNECFVSDIIGTFNIGAPTISHHLKELSNADLISTERRGKFLVAKVNAVTIEVINEILKLENRPG